MKIMQSYYEIVVYAPDESMDAITNLLREMGSAGFFERQGGLVACFDSSADIEHITSGLEQFHDVLEASGLAPDFSFDYSLHKGRDWNEAWKASFQPVDVGNSLTIVPSWLHHETERTAVVIDPAMAFGTGYHETTRRCLMLIERFATEYSGGSFLDIGTGTGILAIAAGALGFDRIEAVDNDEEAVDAALKNIELNQYSGVRVSCGDIYSVTGQFDFITANLLADILSEISPDICTCLKPGGRALYSGMITGQEPAVIRAAQAAGLVHEQSYRDDKWITLVLVRQ